MVYGVAMALLEAAVVVYMRYLYYPDTPLEIFPLKFLSVYDTVVELSRELATVVMIIAVAWLAEMRSATRRFAAFVFVFGIWDLFYYVWLKVLMGWPRHWLEWDVLFLIPTVWLGPWICPVLISVLFIVWGYWIMSDSNAKDLTRRGVLWFVVGALLGLVAFMQPAIRELLVGGMEGLGRYVPGTFWWWMFVPSLALMGYGLMQVKSEALE